jgi:coatomer protein complex subunit gamma
MKIKSDRDEDGGLGGNPFAGLEKSTVLQETRGFNETPIRPAKCVGMLTKLLYVMNQGETVSAAEATDAFFAMTKLFQCSDVALRRMLFLAIRELSKIAQDVIIVTSSLTKDMTGKEEAFKGPAIRALCAIADGGMMQQIERYMKQAVVSKNPHVASAALVSSLKLYTLGGGGDVVKRWLNEAQEALNSDNVMIQFHALGLLYQIKKKDQLAVSKLVAKLSKSSLRSPYACCFLIRVAYNLIEQNGEGPSSSMYDFIESCLRHRHEMVIYEAAAALVAMTGITAKDLAPAVSVLQLFCSSPKPTLRFAAVRTLNKIAINHPSAVTACNLDLENLISDSNRSIATLAITTLLKTGNESSVDRLMKQITSFMSEISDEFKTVVVDAIQALCHKFPRKFSILLNFLAGMLRDEGGFVYKKAIVDAIISIVEENTDARETGLAHLCEFIEDCEHTVLATRILHLLGREGPKTSQPSKYIRFIYNRVLLENPAVTAAAVTTLAKFGAVCEDLLPNIITLLRRCIMDSDDEVRDRATFYLSILEQKERALNSAFILNSISVSIAGLERALLQYTRDPSQWGATFDMKCVPLSAQPLAEQRADMKIQATAAATGGQSTGGAAAASAAHPDKLAGVRQEVYTEQLAAIPDFASLGPLFKSSSPQELTEAETEYVAQVVKHTFQHHIVLQFNCTNTLQDQLLERVYVGIEPSTDDFVVQKVIPCARLVYNQPGICYTLLQLPADQTELTCNLSAVLKFVVKDCDPNTFEPDSDEGFEDEYVLEDVELGLSDHVTRVLKSNFGAAWDALADHEVEETFALGTVNTLQEAVNNIVTFMGMQACERSDRVPDGQNKHVLFLSGVFRGGAEVLLRVRFALVDGVAIHVTVRSTDPAVSDVIAASVG